MSTTAADPTTTFLASLSDPSKFRKVEGVPIWVPHERTVTLQDGTTRTIRVTPADLPRYAAELNRLERERGVVVTGTEGHTRPGEPQAAQPRTLAYFRNARVGTFGPANTPAVLVDGHYPVDTADYALREYPFRSVELHLDGRIGGVALLKTRPWLDMGMVAVYESGDVILYARYKGEVVPDAHTPPVHYAAAMEWVRAVPGRRYEQFPGDVVRAAPPPAPQADPHQAPPDHQRVLQLVRQKPGLSYEAAQNLLRYSG